MSSMCTALGMPRMPLGMHGLHAASTAPQTALSAACVSACTGWHTHSCWDTVFYAILQGDS
jgi:hypothetical protein